MFHPRKPARLVNLLLLLPLLATACASTAQVAGGGPTARAWPAPPDPAIARLVAAANSDDAMGLAVVHPQAWGSLRRQLAPLPPFQEMLRDQPWLASDDPWPSLLVLLCLRNDQDKSVPPDIAGWDHSRPLAIAWVDDGPKGLIQRFNTAFFDYATRPLRLRLVVPATDAGTLAKAFHDLLVSLHGEAGPAGQYVLEQGRLGVGLFPGGDFVRLELVYVDRGRREESQKQVLRGLAAAKNPSRGRAEGATDPIQRLLANGHGVALTLRPLALARWLQAQVAAKIIGALFGAPGRYRTQIKVAGAGEWLLGYLFVNAGIPEIAETAIAMDFDHGLEAVTLTRLSAAGQARMAGAFHQDVVPIATDPNALLSFSLALPRRGEQAPEAFPYRSELRLKSFEDLGRAIEEGGTAAWLAIGTQPLAIWNFIRNNEDFSRELPATWPSEASFELLDFTRRKPVPAFQVRIRLPKGDSSAAGWIAAAKDLSGKLGESHPEVRQVARPDATWVTLRQNVTQSRAGDQGGLAADAPGTFAVVRANFGAIADRLAQEPSRFLGRRDRELFQMLRLLGRAESKVRWRNGWLIGESRLGTSGTAPLPPYEPALPTSAPVAWTGPTAGERGLAHAVAVAQRMLNALGAVAPAERMTIVARGRAEFGDDLAAAKRDPSTMFEAMALDWLLLNLSKDMEIDEIRKANDPSTRPCPTSDEKEEVPAVELIDEVKAPPVRPPRSSRHPRKRGR
jgi:hypothetical protein